MQKSENKKSRLKKSETSLRHRNKTERIDINTSEQRKQDDQDNKQEERYKTLLENIPCALYSTCPGETGPTIFLSKNWTDWTGYSAEELYHDPEAWPKCIHPDDREKAVNAYIEACINETPYSLVYRIVHRDTGQVHHVRDQGFLSKDKKGEIIKVDGIITDISELTRAENELVKYRDHLEELVRERTAELARANEVLELQEKESRKAVEALRESENRYKAVIDNAQEGIVVVQDKILKLANPQVMVIVGYTEEELKSLPFIEFIHPDDREMVMGIHLRRFKGEEIPGVYEIRIIDKQGKTKWLENNGLMIEWGGRPATLNFIRDITEHKKAEEELKKQQYYLEKAQDIGCIGTWELDIEKNVLVWTDENYRIFGIPKGTELTYEAFLNCVHPDDREYVDKKWKASFNKEPYDIEHRILVDGDVRWVREKAEVEFNDKGDCIRGIGFTQDITERKKAEKALRESEENYRLANQAAGIVSWRVIAPEMKVESGGALEQMLGYKEGEIQDWYDVTHPDDRERLRELWAAIVNGELNRYDVEHRMIRKDGRILWFSINSEVKRDDTGGLLYIIGTTQDITERKKAEEQLLSYQAKLKSLASQLSVIEERERRRIATELHDQIGQSLVFSKTKLDSMRSSISSGELNDSLGEICDCLGQVIRDTRTLTFDLSYPILYELGFEAAVSEWLDDQIGSNYGIKTKFEDDGQPKLLDEDICALLFRNVRELLVNVVKHANAQNVKVSIFKVDKQICVIVEDDGIGLKPAEVTSLATGNSGFGIFSIRERLEQLGGRLEIDSEEGRGSKITMTAPLKLTKSQQ